MWINIEYIKVGEKQFKKLDKHKVEQHRKAFEMEEEVMPIDVSKLGTNEYCICGNGRHRYFGAIEAGIKMIELNVLNE